MLSRLRFALKSLRTRIALVVMGVGLLTTLSILLYEQHLAVQSMTQAQEESARNLVSTVALSVEDQFQSILFHKRASMEKRKAMLRSVLELAMSQVELAHHEVESGRLTEAEAKIQAIHALKWMRYDNGVGYVWINDTVRPYPNMIMHAMMPELDGQVLDAPRFNCALGRSENLFRAMVDVCLQDGRGFVDYLWPKPTQDGLTDRQPKLSYVELFEPWGWVVGTGLYIDDIERDEQERLAAVLEELRHSFSQVKVAQTGYMFLFTGDQEMLIHPYLAGADFSQLLSPVTGNPILLDLIQAAHDPSNKLLYVWDKPPEFTGQFEFRKLAFVQYFEPLDWYIASSVYHDEMEQPALANRGRAMMLGGAMLLIGLILSLWLANSLTRPLLRLSRAARDIEMDGGSRDRVPVSGTIETRQLGAVLNGMLSSLQGEIEERRQAEVTLRAALEEKEVATRAKSEFLARMSHELRTPLNAIIGYTEWLLCGRILQEATAEELEALRAVGACSDHLLDLVNNVLDQARIEAGKIELTREPFALHELFRQVEKVFIFRVEEKNITLGFEVSKDVSEYAIGDALRLRQVLVNLVGNAVKFTDTGGVTVRADVERSPDGERLVCGVEDTGIGISETNQERIFESFTQADQSTACTYGGTGLGLTISRQLIEMMGGEIGVRSNTGGGSTFWFRIPLHRCAPESLPTAQRLGTSDHEDDGDAVSSPVDILVVEDYSVNQQVAWLNLSEAGHRVDIANNGFEAVEACESKQYELILMDVQMPIMDGFEATRKIRSGGSPCAGSVILGATAHADPASRQACLDAGMDDMVTKPLRRQVLMQTIHRLLHAAGTGSSRGESASDASQVESTTQPSDLLSSPMDLAAAIDEFGDLELLRSVIDGFLDNLKQQLQAMEEAAATLNLEALRPESHAIKGGAASLEAVPLSRAAAELEACCMSGSADQALQKFAIVKERVRELEAFVYQQFADNAGG